MSCLCGEESAVVVEDYDESCPTFCAIREHNVVCSFINDGYVEHLDFMYVFQGTYQFH